MNRDNGANLALLMAGILTGVGLAHRSEGSAADLRARAAHFRRLLAPGSGASQAEQETARKLLDKIEKEIGPEITPPHREPTRPYNPPRRQSPISRPPWQTDTRSTSNEIYTRSFKDINFLKKSTYEHAMETHGSVEEVYFFEFDGYYMRHGATLFSNKKDLEYASFAFNGWCTMGPLTYTDGGNWCYSIFIQDKNKDLFLVRSKEKFINPPLKIEYDKEDPDERWQDLFRNSEKMRKLIERA